MPRRRMRLLCSLASPSRNLCKRKNGFFFTKKKYLPRRPYLQHMGRSGNQCHETSRQCRWHSPSSPNPRFRTDKGSSENSNRLKRQIYSILATECLSELQKPELTNADRKHNSIDNLQLECDQREHQEINSSHQNI
jgi:hypothetical protein